MYSPAALPPRQRAAPAKNRRLSAIAGISSLVTASIGLPALSASRRAISEPCSSITSAIASSARAARGPHGQVHLLGAGDGCEGELLAGGGVEHGFALAARGHPLAVDEVAEGLCGARHLSLPSSWGVWVE